MDRARKYEELREAKRKEAEQVRLSRMSQLEIAGRTLTVDDIATATGKSRQTVLDQMQRVRLGVLPLARLLSEKLEVVVGNKYGHVGRQIAFNGETMSMRQWGKRLGISGFAIRKRLERMSLEEALTKPRAEHKVKQQESNQP